MVPAGNVAGVVMARGATMVRLNCLLMVCGVGVSESVTTTVNGAPVTAAVGVPEIVPEELKLSPVGKLLPEARLHV